MASPSRSGPAESSEAHIRKRVGKACDRCRLKKSKCDGANPCTRCRADNTLCQFGERKKSHDKAYPRGYVEILEQQQSQLVQGLQHMYQLLRNGEQWPGEPLTNQSNGSPLTHDILARLGLLQPKEDDSHEHENFEEDPVQTERRLIEAGAPRVKRRASFSSDSEHDHDHQQISPVSDTSPHSTTPTSASARQPTFSHPFPRQPIQLTPSSNQSPASVAPQLSTPFQSSPQQISSVPPAALHPSTLQEPWVSSELNMGNSFEDSINSMDLDQYPSYDFSGINFDSTMASTTQGMSGFGPTAPLFIDDFVNDPSQLELTPYLSQTVS